MPSPMSRTKAARSAGEIPQTQLFEQAAWHQFDPSACIIEVEPWSLGWFLKVQPMVQMTHGSTQLAAALREALDPCMAWETK